MPTRDQIAGAVTVLAGWGIAVAIVLILLTGCATAPVAAPQAGPPLPLATIGDLPSEALVGPAVCPSGLNVILAQFERDGASYRLLIAIQTHRFLLIADDVVWLGTVGDQNRLTLTVVKPKDEVQAQYPSPCDYLDGGVGA